MLFGIKYYLWIVFDDDHNDDNYIIKNSFYDFLLDKSLI